jgi:hypothetical protein
MPDISGTYRPYSATEITAIRIESLIPDCDRLRSNRAGAIWVQPVYGGSDLTLTVHIDDERGHDGRYSSSNNTWVNVSLSKDASIYLAHKLMEQAREMSDERVNSFTFDGDMIDDDIFPADDDEF